MMGRLGCGNGKPGGSEGAQEGPSPAGLPGCTCSLVETKFGEGLAGSRSRDG